MERLTKKDDFFDYVLPEQNIFGDNQAFEISLGKTEYTCKLHITGEAIKRFGELEDVLEKYGIVNLDEFIKEYSSRNIKLANDNYALEQELAELKQKAIVLEKAFELACDPRDDWGGEKYSGTEFNNYHDYFIAEAEQKLAEIGGKDEQKY